MRRVSKKLISNVTFLFLDWTILSGLSFLYWLIAGKALLPNEYGIISTSLNFAVLLSGLSLLGLNMAVTKLIPEYLGRRQNKKVSGLIWFSIKVTVIINLILMALLLIFSSFFVSILKITHQIIWMIVIILLIHSISGLFGSILHGFQRMKKVFQTDLIGSVCKVFISAGLIFIGIGYFGPLIGFLIGFLITAMSRWASVRPKTELEVIDQKNVMMEYALPAFVTHVGWLTMTNGQYVILTILKNPEITGIFTVAMILTLPILIIHQAVASGLFPIISQLTVNKDSKRRQNHLIRMSLRYALFISLPVAFLLILFSKPIILIFSRPEYLSASKLLPILTLGAIINGCGIILSSSLYGISKTKLNRNIAIVTTLVFLSLSLSLTHYLPSAYGVVIAYVISVVTTVILSFIFLRKNLELTLPWESVGKLVLATAISFGFLLLVIRFAESFIIGIILACIAGLIYLILLIPLRFYTKEDAKVVAFITERSPFFRKQLLSFLKFLLRFI